MLKKPVGNRLAKRLAKNLRAARLDRQLTQEEVAEKSDLSTFYVIRIENQRANPSLAVVEKLASVFGVDPEWLLVEH